MAGNAVFLTRREARGIEQIIFEQNPQFSNILNPISTRKYYYSEARAFGHAWLKQKNINTYFGD